MTHFNEEELSAAYYEGTGPELKSHLDACPECQTLFRSISETLDMASDAPLPQRGPDYPHEVWTRLQPALQPAITKSWFRGWVVAPVATMLLAIVFVAGMLTEHKRKTPAVDTRSERLLYLTMSEHLQQAQHVLTDVAHPESAVSTLNEERVRARDLITQNRILRERALHRGDKTDAAVLEDLERVLLEVANGTVDLEAVRESMTNANLLFRIRISSSDARIKGERL